MKKVGDRFKCETMPEYKLNTVGNAMETHISEVVLEHVESGDRHTS